MELPLPELGEQSLRLFVSKPGFFGQAHEFLITRVANLNDEANMRRSVAESSYQRLEPFTNIIGKTIAFQGKMKGLSRDGAVTVSGLSVERGCLRPPCIVEVTGRWRTDWHEGGRFEVFGKITGTKPGPVANRPIIQVEADFSLGLR